MKKKIQRQQLALAVWASAAFISTPALAQDDPTVNRMLASQCFQCHGYNGHALGDIDSLAGESRNEISEEMLEAHWESGGGIMEHQARGYTSDQIRRLAAFFATVDASTDPSVSAPLSLSGGESGGGSGDESGGDSDDDHSAGGEDGARYNPDRSREGENKDKESEKDKGGDGRQYSDDDYRFAEPAFSRSKRVRRRSDEDR